MRKLIFRALIVLSMGLYSLATAPDAAAAAGEATCPILPCLGGDFDREYCLNTCGTPHYTCSVDPYQPYGMPLRRCTVGADN